MTTILDTPEQIDMYRWLMIRRGLKLKIETGMELTGRISTLKAAKMHGFTDKGTAKAAFKQMNDIGEANGIERLYLKGEEPV
jgi:hypothetical protein